MPGPAPTPTNILAARGSRLVERRTKEPQPAKGLPKPVRKLTGPAKKHYDETLKLLGPLKVLTIADGEALTAYAMLCAEFDRAVKDRDIRLAVQIESKLAGARARFGLTPADRARVQASEDDTADTPDTNDDEPPVLRIA